MADKLIIVMMNSNPENAIEVVPPLAQATVAAAMEFEVEVIFTGRAAGLVRRGYPEQLSLKGGRTVYDVIKEAAAAGVSLKVCATGLEQWGDDVVPEISETVGAAYLISEAMDSATVTFTY